MAHRSDPQRASQCRVVEVGEQPQRLRAGESGRVSAMRVFAQNDRRGLGVRLSSLLSPEDAQVYIADASNRMAEVRFRPSAKIVMTSQPTVEVAEIPGAEDARCLEHAALSVKGDLTILTAAGRVEACVFVVQGSSCAINGVGTSWLRSQRYRPSGFIKRRDANQVLIAGDTLAGWKESRRVSSLSAYQRSVATSSKQKSRSASAHVIGGTAVPRFDLCGSGVRCLVDLADACDRTRSSAVSAGEGVTRVTAITG